ncbi:homeobox protein cut isoform X7 [Pieris brassicae]|uniref:homeobox protein cut isoform X7 n=1 Tax=Pieris brassicae TaxID=7116 RepID=UPI001E661D9A|nr:homeobox protein cut isoform X7 [Pieris brassicae]
MHPTGAASLPAAPEAEVQAMHSMDWLFKKERIYLLAQFWQQRATLAEKEVTTLKEQLATTSPTPLQAAIPKTNGSIEPARESETRISDFTPDIKEEKRRSPDIDEDIEQKIEMAATARSNNNSSRSSPVVNQTNNLENELAAKEKEIAQLVEDVRRLQASLSALQEAHAQQLQRLEERLDEKKQHIARLEARLDTQRDYDDIKREISMLRFSELGPERPHIIPPPKDIFGSQNHLLRSMDIAERERKMEPLRSPAQPMREERNSTERERSTERRDTGTKDGTAGAGFGRSDGEGDERLAHILTEASHMIKTPTGQPNNDDSSTLMSNEDSSSPRTQCPSPFSNKDSSQNRRLKKYENDDIPQEKVVRIYQEELAKIMTRRGEDMRHNREGFPGMFPPFFSGGMPPQIERPPEDIRMALEAYHRELAKIQGGNIPLHNLPGIPPFPNLIALQQLQAQTHINGSGAVQDLSLPKDKNTKINGMTDSDKDKMDAEEAIRHAGSAFSLVRPKLEPGQQSTGSSASSPLGNAILPPAITPNEDFNSSAAASPLQRMASITNSLISQPPNPPHHAPPQRSMKAVLPPITQQQFDLFNNLNTEDIVKRVKEALSQYSISQRLFGESVLGLSQGSVSDLLARPKPWHMLTQKGREPFIRMKMFLEDDNAVHKLVASQYKIAPEKLMRTGNYSGAPVCPPNMSKPMPPTQKMISDATSLLSKMQHEQLLGPHLPHLPPGPLLLTPPGFPPHHAVTLPPQHHENKERKPPPPPQHQMRALHQHMSPSVYEMAALTQDLDTQTITTKIKEALLANNIGQKIFGEAVLGLSQGSVSELLSKPKPWHMLSIKGREPFIRMQLWLSDAHNIDRLQALKNERREANKRRRSSGPGQDNSSDTSSNDTSEFYHSSSPGPTSGVPSAKKQRVLFSEEQKEALRLAFALDPYPNMPTIEFLAAELGLSTRTITNWFHNHRMRLKQQAPHGLPAEPPARDQSSAPFDPVQFRLLLNQRLLELQKERMGLAGVPLPYPPYFAANSNFAALIGRGLLPPEDHKNTASGLDLSMPLKREPDADDFEDDDLESNLGSEDSLDDESKNEPKATSTPARSSRRKPAAPQWVNPDWQDEKPRNPDEVIINGVCVMRSDDFRREAEETVRIEPSPAPRENTSPSLAPAPSPLTRESPEVLPEDKIKTETEDDRWEY